jgi:hypothetical protein
VIILPHTTTTLPLLVLAYIIFFDLYCLLLTLSTQATPVVIDCKHLSSFYGALGTGHNTVRSIVVVVIGNGEVNSSGGCWKQ